MSLRNQNLPTRRNDRTFGDLFDRYARDFFSNALTPWGEEGESAGFLPKIQVKESDTTYEVSAELPGLKENEINVTLRENSLIIEGEKKSESKNEEKGSFRSEFQYGRFYRSIPLEADVDNKNIEASYKDGLLTVLLKKRNDGVEKTVKIPIKH